MLLAEFGLVLLCGFLLGALAKKLGLPPLVGMLCGGLLLSPLLVGGELVAISAHLRQIALVIILLRAGLALEWKQLWQVGRPAVLLCFLPALFEFFAVLLLAPVLFGFSYLEAALLGAVLAAVSPAVIVPRMLGFIERGFGQKHHVPQLMMAGAAADDVFVIVLFNAFLALNMGGDFAPSSLAKIPLSVVFGGIVGFGLGIGLSRLFRHMGALKQGQLVVLLSLGCLLPWVETALSAYLPFSGLLAVMTMGMGFLSGDGVAAKKLATGFSSLWSGAEIWLFVLVGVAVDPALAIKAGGAAVILLCGALALRSLAVLFCLLGTRLSPRERGFCVITYLPKATVQAAIGGVPLAMGLACGETILAVAVVAILLSAPLGAMAIDACNLLEKDK